MNTSVKFSGNKQASIVKVEKLYQSQKYNQCISACVAALKIFPNELVFHDLCALSYLLTDQDQKAIERYSIALKISPNNFLAKILNLRLNKFAKSN